jgi:hypothetical protein
MKVVLALVLAGLVALPLRVSAQAGEESTTSEPNLQEPAPSAEPAGEEAQAGDEHSLSFWHDEALKIALFSSCPPPPPRTPDGYTLEEMDVRVKRAGIGLSVSLVALVAGAALAPAAVAQTASCVSFFEPCNESFAVYIAGGILFVGGLAGTIISGIKLRRRKRDRESLRQAHYGTPRRVQWDLARSRLVF